MEQISRREYFIGQVLAGLLANNGAETSIFNREKAIEIADALIARLDGEKV